MGLSMADLVQNVSVRSRRPRSRGALDLGAAAVDPRRADGARAARLAAGPQGLVVGPRAPRLVPGHRRGLGDAQDVDGRDGAGVGAHARRRGSNAEALTESDLLFGPCNTVHEQVRDEVRRALDSRTVGAAPLGRPRPARRRGEAVRGARADGGGGGGAGDDEGAQRVRGLIHQTGGMKWEVRRRRRSPREGDDLVAPLRQSPADRPPPQERRRFAASPPRPPSQAPPTKRPSPSRARAGSLYLSAVVAAAPAGARRRAAAAAPAPAEENSSSPTSSSGSTSGATSTSTTRRSTRSRRSAPAPSSRSRPLVSPTKVAAASAEVARAAACGRSGGRAARRRGRRRARRLRVARVGRDLRGAGRGRRGVRRDERARDAFDVETGTRWVLGRRPSRRMLWPCSRSVWRSPPRWCGEGSGGGEAVRLVVYES